MRVHFSPLRTPSFSVSITLRSGWIEMAIRSAQSVAARLQVEEVGVRTALPHELRVRPLLDDPPAGQDVDPIG